MPDDTPAALTLAVLNSKGGAGKTTLATSLARAYALDGLSVVLIDTDRQGTATDWARAAPDGYGLPVVQVATPDALRSTLPALSGGVGDAASPDVAVIDGAAQVAEMLGACVAVADAVVIPVQPSPADVWGASTVVQLVRRTRTPAAFVVSQARAGTNLASEIGDALDGYGLPILRTPDGAPARTCQRVAYPTAMLQGRTVLDTAPKGKAAAEVQAIADAVAAFLEQATGDATSPTNPNE